VTPTDLLAEVRLGTAQDSIRVGATIATSFRDDAITRWVVPPEAHPGPLPEYFGAAAAAAVEAGYVYILGDFEAVAVWFDATAPAPPPPPEPDAAMIEVCGAFAENFHRLEHLMYAAHPKEPAHHYLAFLAVRKELRGRGVGKALLDLHHEELDKTGLGGYLDASNPDSRRMYLRNGYRDLGRPFSAPGGPPMWPMWRPPGGEAH
jgi:GNAT superfamily N-acetyltransferase